MLYVALYNYVVLPWMRDSVGRKHVHIITLYTLNMTLCKNMMVFIYCVVFGMYVCQVLSLPTGVPIDICYLDPSHGVARHWCTHCHVVYVTSLPWCRHWCTH